MAGDAKKLQPIIIKRVKKGGHSAHGGAWKIAYADFVTAMMAFFLLMWLLGSTSEGDKKGIADYFQSPLKIALLASGSGAGDASHVVKGGGEDMTRSTGQVKRGDGDLRFGSEHRRQLRRRGRARVRRRHGPRARPPRPVRQVYAREVRGPRRLSAASPGARHPLRGQGSIPSAAVDA